MPVPSRCVSLGLPFSGRLLAPVHAPVRRGEREGSGAGGERQGEAGTVRQVWRILTASNIGKILTVGEITEIMKHETNETEVNDWRYFRKRRMMEILKKKFCIKRFLSEIYFWEWLLSRKGSFMMFLMRDRNCKMNRKISVLRIRYTYSEAPVQDLECAKSHVLRLYAYSLCILCSDLHTHTHTYHLNCIYLRGNIPESLLCCPFCVLPDLIFFPKI